MYVHFLFNLLLLDRLFHINSFFNQKYLINKFQSYTGIFQEISTTDKTQLKVVTFNILAPCYKRLNKVISSEPDVKSRSIFEATDEILYLQRSIEICEMILKLNPG